MKKLGFNIFIIVVFVCAAAFGALLIEKTNQKRVSLANFYEEKATNSAKTDEKILFLSKSDALSPTGTKKITLANLYLESGDPDKAEIYLRQTTLTEADQMLVEYYLLHSPDKASRYFTSLTENSQDEYWVYLDIISGKKQTTDLIDPETNIGRLLVAIKEQDYSPLGAVPLMKQVNNTVAVSDNVNNQTYALAQYFDSIRLPYLALYTYRALDARIGITAPVAYEKAKLYMKVGDYKSAQEEIAIAIKYQPENVSYYTDGVLIARKNVDSARADFWAARLRELEILAK